MSGLDGDELDTAIAKLEALAHLGTHLAEIAAPALEEVARAQWAAGKGPSGTTWAKTKKGGRIALTALTEKITVEGKGNTIRVSGSTILDAHVRSRRAMPAQGNALPRAWRAAVEKAIQQKVDEIGR
ncbi:MAG: hypothetical protein ABI134_36110 [Byssovorax sp.]